MTGEQGDLRAKLQGIIAIEAIDNVARALGLDIESVRAMHDGTTEIYAACAAWIDSEVPRLEAEGLWVAAAAAAAEPEEIGPDDATAEAPGPTVPEAGPHDVENPQAALRAMAEGVHQRVKHMTIDNTLSQYDRELVDLLMHRLDLQLHFRQPLGAESAKDREDLIRFLREHLRSVEKRRKENRGWFHWLRKSRDLSGDELYNRLIHEWCAATEADPELALRVGVRGIGQFLYPESYATTARQVTRLDEGRRRAAEDLIEAILLAEESEFLSPLPCEEELAAQGIRYCMELILITELGVAPPPYTADVPVARREMDRMVELRRNRLAWVDGRHQECRRYKGRQTAIALFHRLVEESGAEKCRRLYRILNWDIQALCRDFLSGQGPKGFFNYPDVPPRPGS